MIAERARVSLIIHGLNVPSAGRFALLLLATYAVVSVVLQLALPCPHSRYINPTPWLFSLLYIARSNAVVELAASSRRAR